MAVLATVLAAARVVGRGRGIVLLRILLLIVLLRILLVARWRRGGRKRLASVRTLPRTARILHRQKKEEKGK